MAKKYNNSIVSGTQYQFDLQDLAMIGKSGQGLVLSYKQGLVSRIDIYEPVDRERQFQELCKLHRDYNSKP